MNVHNKIGTKERFLEMFQNVNKVKLTESAMWGNKVVNESKYFDYILQGHEATEENAIQAAQGLDWQAIETYEEHFDNLKYIDSVNGVGIYYHVPVDSYYFTDESMDESFDNPIAKDKEYLDKTVGDQSSQVSKYDDGTRYPVEDKLKVKDPSLEKMKGDDAPIVEAFGEDDQDVADDSAEEKPAWDENFGGEEEEPAETEETEAEVEDPEMAIDNIPAGDGEEAPELDNEIENGGINQMTNTEEAPHEDQIEGGLADNANPTDFCPVQISKGIQIEMEHTDDPHKALEIAMDHLVEIPDYYDRLEAMEAEAKGEGQGSMEDDVEAPEDALLDPSKHWVDDYAPQNVSMDDEPIEEDFNNQGTPEDKYQIYLDQANDGNGNDSTTGEPLLTFDEWLNN